MNKHLARKIAVRVLFALAVFAIASFAFVGRASAASPEVQTRSATDVSEDSAQLNGYLYTNGEDTTYWFEYGTSRSNLDYETSEREVSDRDGRVTVYNIIRNGLDPDETYYFRIVAENDDGIDRGEILSFQTDDDFNDNDYDAPEVDTLSVQVNGNSAVLEGRVYSHGSPQVWFRYGQSRGSLNSATPMVLIFGDGDMYFSRTIQNLVPGATYYYQAAAKNSDGTDYGDILSFTASGSGSGSSQTPAVSTNSATVTGAGSATLNAQVDPNGNLSSVWFEYGRSTGLGSVTTRDPAGSGNSYSNYSANLNGLAAGTTYYYRAVAQNSFGVTRGQIASFRTQGSPSVPPTPSDPAIPSNPSVPSNPSSTSDCLIVSPAVSSQELKANDAFTYSVTYRNDCDSAISGASLRVALPQAIDFAGTNYPFLTRDGNVITYNLGVVARNFQAIVTVDGRVRSQVESGDSLIFQSDIDFTDQRGNLRNASGFLSVMIVDGGATTVGTSTLSASAADALGGLFHSGWFWLILFLILAALFVFWLATRRRGDETEEDEEDTDMVHGAH